MELTQKRLNKIGLGMIKMAGIMIMLTIACTCFFHGYTTWGLIFLFADCALAGMLIIDIQFWENM